MKLDTIAREHAEALREATAAAPIPPRSPRQARRGWVVAVGTALLVLVVVGLSGLFERGGDTVAPGSTPTTTATATAAPSAPETEAVTALAEGWPSYEMAFELSDGTYGRIQWISEKIWSVERWRWNDDGLGELVYGLGSDYGPSFVNDPNDLLPDVEYGPELRVTVPDPTVPFDLVIDRAAITAALESGTAIEPTHPLAATAYRTEAGTIELDAAGIPVAVVPADAARTEFRATTLDQREILVGGVGPQILGEFPIAAHLAADTTTEQRALIAKGFLTHQDYVDAVERTIACIQQAEEGDPAANWQGRSWAGPVLMAAEDSALAAVERCRVQHLEQVEELWSYQTTTWPNRDLERLSYEMAGDTEALAVLDGEPGEPVTFPDLEFGFVEAYVQGPGVCADIRRGGGSGVECAATSSWEVPDTLRFSVSYTWNSGTSGLGHLSLEGFAPLGARDLEIEFTSGETIRVPTAQPSGEFPYSAFTYASDDGQFGFPVHVRVLDAAGDELAALDFRAYYCDPNTISPKDAPMGLALCGAG